MENTQEFVDETSFLLPKQNNSKLTLIFAIICIVDVFGVFPVIALPKAVIDCGFYGILIIISVCSVQIYTATLLGRSWMIAEEILPEIEQKNRYPYSALTEITFGSRFANFVSFLLNVTIFGGGIPNLIVASQNLELLGLRLSDNSFNVSFCFWIIIIGFILCPVLWLGSPKDMKILCTVSVMIVMLVFLLVAGCLLFSSSSSEVILKDQSIILEPQRSFWELSLTAYGIITFQYDIHPSILTIQVDMKEKSKLTRAILTGFAISLIMFSIITLITAIKFGNLTAPGILETLPTSAALHFAAFVVALQLCLSSAVSNSALYQHIEDCMSISRVFNHRRCVLRTMLTLLAIVIAESVPRFDLVMSLIGGTLTAPLVFILPPLIYLRMLSKQKKREELAMQSIIYHQEADKVASEDFIIEIKRMDKGWIRIETGFCIFIILASVICTIASTYVNVITAIEFVQFTQPCLYNVSMALVQI